MVGTLTHVGRLAISDTCTIIIVEITGSEQLNKEALKKNKQPIYREDDIYQFPAGKQEDSRGGGNP